MNDTSTKTPGSPAARVEVLRPDGVIEGRFGGSAACGEHAYRARAAATADDAGGTATVDDLPWRDAAAREGAARSLAADRSLDAATRRRLVARAAATPVLELPDAPMTVVVEFVSPPDWGLADRLGDDFWEEDGRPSRLLCAATVRTEDGASVDCSAARFRTPGEREAAVRRVASYAGLRPEERAEIADRVARTPITPYG